ncbi:BLUF domain-containing protein [Pelagicoccus sp. NFK12]|uniref:BLUF domain-containing protein n=1 Tax=Pelagicoccus enzymogenes TaxID=2773457 RepID=A0A927F5Z0_9BACT|nr:BLUF domain-containing protein [Pelagicoccus enzymogenes]MBD5779033.1 BLUF domain-containing protein [Pelagicoccus enzymogenes]MDQ8200724.1 BLUF domain-containing protein [Pelagicoccus enzymogenes]
MPLVQIAYASSAAEPFTKEELVELLKKSRQKNQERGITGLLLYKEGNFLQILEGESPIIRETLQRIEADPRHRGFLTIFKRNVEEREFPDWSMAFRNLNDPEIDRIPGYNEFLNLKFDPESLQEDSSSVERLIGTFAKAIR